MNFSSEDLHESLINVLCINIQCQIFSLISATAAKIANEIFQLGKTEISELATRRIVS